MDYQILDWKSSSELKQRMNGKEIMNIDFNLSTVFFLNDSTYLIQPLNPFGNSLLTKSKTLLDKWIANELFPVVDTETSFYFDNKEKIDHLLSYKEVLISDLYKFVFGEKKSDNYRFTPQDSEKIYQTLKRKKKINEYRLNFMVLVGDMIIENNKDWKWGILRNKQLLNPVITLVIVKDADSGIYYNLEEQLYGKWGYMGIEYIFKTISSTNKRSNEIEEIITVM